MKIKNWDKFQHYKNRRPPWIKLHRELLDDPEWHRLRGDDAKFLLMLWLVASDTLDGCLPKLEKLAFRLHLTPEKAKELISRLSGWVVQDASGPLAQCLQDAIPETEGETEKETETKKDIVDQVTDRPPAPKPSENGTAGPTPQHVVDLWNAQAHANLPRVEILTERRRATLKVRLAEHPEKGFWEALLAKVNASPLLRGDNDRGWRASFDWIINPSNMAKILEGNYDRRKF